jgi:hypothetical protein
LYFRGASVAAGETLDAGIRTPFQGASLAGWIVESDGGLARASSRIAVSPIHSATATREASTLVGETDRRGFFQIGPLRPGMYKTKVDSEKALSLSTQVRIEEDKETRLLSALVLEPVAALKITVSPAEDPGRNDRRNRGR